MVRGCILVLWCGTVCCIVLASVVHGLTLCLHVLPDLVLAPACFCQVRLPRADDHRQKQTEAARLDLT